MLLGLSVSQAWSFRKLYYVNEGMAGALYTAVCKIKPSPSLVSTCYGLPNDSLGLHFKVAFTKFISTKQNRFIGDNPGGYFIQ